MSRITRWTPEKTKVKVVFRLQFHATHIPQTGWNNLFISVIPSDSGKATAKTNKANVRNGTCKWADPIYESTRLLLDSRTNQYEEKLYKLVVAMGTSRSSLLGEANINLSNYVDVSKPIVVALPLHGSKSGAILHVIAQLLTSTPGFREFEQQREASDRGFPANIDHDGRKLSTLGERVVSHADKVTPRVGSKPEPKELPSLEVDSGFSKGYADSTVGSSNTSGKLYAEKQKNSSTREVDSTKITISGNLGGVSPSQSPTMDKGQPYHHSRWGPETSMDREMVIVYEENSRLKVDLEAADLSIHELKKEIASLQNFVSDLSIRAHNLTEQIAVEISSEKILAEEVSMLKSECVRFRHDLEWIRNFKKNSLFPGRKLKDSEDLSLGVELCHPEGVLLPGLLTLETSSMEANNAMQGEIFRLLKEVIESKAERENLVRKMDQMKCYYEGLVQELEENQKEILFELENLRHEHSSCIYTFSSAKAQMEVVHEKMNDELLQLGEERCKLDVLNKELERRAATSEEALRSARINYSIVVDQLQKDLEVLSLQVLSMHETNENLIGKALSEASQPFPQGCEKAEIVSHDAEGSNLDQSMESQSLNVVLKNHYMVSDRLLEEDLYRKMQEEISEMHLANIHLDVFSVTLHQALLEASLDSRTKMNELAEQLELSCRSNLSLRLKLKNISNEICTLNEEKAIWCSRSNDLALENRTLAAKLRSVSDEKCILTERIGELGNQPEQAAIDEHHLSNEVSLLQEEVMTMKIKVSENEKLLKVLNYIQERLENLLVIGDEQANGLLPCRKEEENTSCEKLVSTITRLEEFLRNFNDKILQLTEENNIILDDRDFAWESLDSLEAKAKAVKQEFEHDVLDFVSKLNAFSALVEKLQTDFEAVSNKLQVSSEAEEKYTQMTRDLLSDFIKMEAELQHLTLENRDLLDKIMAFDELKEENLSLKGLLQCNINENDMLTKQLDSVKGTVGSLQDEVSLLRGIRDQLDTQILDLNSQLKERDDRWAQLDHANREDEASSFTSKESLRIAFIKEQYETKLHEISHQLSISEKHGEGMLLKLQDALDDLENRKKIEASQLKRNEKLLLEIEELEIELQLVRADNRENFMAYEQMKAELDCSIMSLDCCKEEKNQLIASLKECNDYKFKLAVEVENLKASIRRAENNNVGCHVLINSQNRSSEVGNLMESSPLSTSCCKGENFVERALSNSNDGQTNHFAYSKNLKFDKQDEKKIKPQAVQEALVTNLTEELSGQGNSENDVEHNGDLLKDQPKPQFLMSIVEHLRKELEQMKSENTLLLGDENLDELLGEVSQEKVSKELENISCLYNDSSRSGNSVERGLASELELSEALKANKKSSVQLQSSSLNLPKDEAEVSQSFRNINELIKDMLEMKKRYNAMESELKEMHECYSQLSLDFAEVEGERQKLFLMLKNVRPSKSLVNRSPTSSHEELSS